MGNSYTVELHADQDSPTNPGCLSMITDSLDDLDPPCSGKAFIDGLVNYLRWPVDDATTEGLLKSVDVEDHSPDCFTVKVILDGGKLDDWKLGRGDRCDRVRRWKKVTVDREKLTVTTEDFVPEAEFGAWVGEASDTEVLATAYIGMLAAPTRIECYLLAGGQRLSGGDAIVAAMKSWTDKILQEIYAHATAAVKVKAGPSKKESGQTSAVSDPMGEHVDYDAFFDNMVTITKDTMAKNPAMTIEDVNDTEFHVVPKPDENGETAMKSKTVVKCSKDAGEMSILFEDGSGKVVYQSFRQVHKEPLVVEGWCVDEKGARKVTDRFVVEQQKAVNAIITKASSWF